MKDYSLHSPEQRDAKLDALREAIAIGMADVYAGRVAPLDMEEVIHKAREQFKRNHPSRFPE